MARTKVAADKEFAQYQETDDLLRRQLSIYCDSLVKIQNKSGEIVPFTFNRQQRHLDEKLEEQRQRVGKVRALILKARKVGMSTYVGARYYRKTTLWPGNNSYILTHEDASTQALFGMVKFMHDQMPKRYKPRATTANANELAFKSLASGYKVGTAKNISGLGRGLTIQNFHGSEIGFWPEAEKHYAGVLQAVPNIAGTEIILESTANGVGGVFYEQWQLAERRQSEYIPIFIPWFWDVENRTFEQLEFDPTNDELEYCQEHDLDVAQLIWMHNKNVELGAKPGEICPLFRQENPATAVEAFQFSTADTLIKAADVVRARKFDAPDQDHAAKVLGVDIARKGGDFTRMVDRQGRAAGKRTNIVMNTDDLMAVVGRIVQEIKEHGYHRVFVDMTGLGSGVVDRLYELGYRRTVTGVHFGQTPNDEKKYRNKRAEMWGELNEWLKDPGGADIPDEDVVQRHLCAPEFSHDSNSRIVLEPKEKIKSRLHLSPDFGDALALTFAETVIIPTVNPRDPYGMGVDELGPVDWMTR